MPDGAQDSLSRYADDVIRRGSRSFTFASRLLDRKTRLGVTLLYTWCRYCDDVVDGQELGAPSRSAPADDSGAALRNLRQATERAVTGQGDLDLPVFKALRALAREFSVPPAYLTDVLDGMAMDVEGRQYQTLQDLQLYAYRVAGAVGLLFAHVAGVSDTKALRHAADLGIAMQLSNIARDVADDWRAGRVYLPLDWLAVSGIKREELMFPANRPALVGVVKRLVTTAERSYESADAGLRFLPLRVAFAVAVARHVYREIGASVVRRGPSAWDQRVVVSTAKKLFLIGRATMSVAATLPSRWRSPWGAARLDGTWRYPWSLQ